MPFLYKSSVVIIAISFILSAKEIRLPVPFDQEIINKGFELIYQADFKEAKKLFSEIKEQYPNRPEGHLLVALQLSMFMNCYKTTSLRSEFYSNADRAVRLAELAIKNSSGTEKAFNMLYYCGAIGYRGLEKIRSDQILPAFFDAMSAMEILRKLNQINNEFHDINFAYGIYHYYLYYYGGKYSMIPHSVEDKEKGYNYLNIAKERGYFLRGEALFSYFTIKIFENETDGLEKEILYFKQKYPNNVFFHYKLIDLYTSTQDWEHIPELSLEAIRLLKNEPLAGPAAYIKLHYQTALAHKEMGNKLHATVHLNELEKYRPLIQNGYQDKQYLSEGKKLRSKL